MKKMLNEYPKLVNEWDYEKNTILGYDINKITSKNGNKVWWICPNCNGNWQATVASRTDDHGCPYCSGRLVKRGINDLETLMPELSEEWNYEKNIDLFPYQFSCKSSKKVWWKGKCGHEWESLISNRSNGSSCPICKLSNVTSFPEQAIYFYIKKHFTDAITRDTHLGVELDIYIPSIKKAIEYDGEAWHTERNLDNDIKKNNICIKNDIELIRIRENKLMNLDNCKIFYRIDTTSDKSLEIVIKEIFKYLKLPTEDINVVKDTGKIMEQYNVLKLDNSLEKCFPNIASEWNYEKNGKLLPSQISKGSRRIVWWKGKCGHEWEMSVDDRTHKRKKNGKSYGCPICSGKRIVDGVNSLSTLYPNISREWNYEKNDNLNPNLVTPFSSRKVWWKCEFGHEWEAVIQSRTKSNTKCPYCSNKKLLIGFNDLKTKCPEISQDWDSTKNNCEPYNVIFRSSKRAYWKCHLCGHEWNTYICSRTKTNTKCPNCKGSDN